MQNIKPAKTNELTNTIRPHNMVFPEVIKPEQISKITTGIQTAKTSQKDHKNSTDKQLTKQRTLQKANISRTSEHLPLIFKK